VALARALARDPQVLLLDEPFSAVDRMTREPLKEELASLRRSLEIPILLVTHDLEEAQALADRICVIERGRTLQTGTPDEVRLRPVSATVARLMGQTNVFEGEVVQSAEPGRPGRLRWGDTVLEVAATGTFRPGERVAWLVPSDYVALEDDGNETANVLRGVVAHIRPLGERVELTIGVDAGTLRLTVGAREARARTPKAGDTISVRLLSDGIHLMALER
jgi:molybdate transport system ATP-binding protein